MRPRPTLKLVPDKGPVTTYVLDHVERPTENEARSATALRLLPAMALRVQIQPHYSLLTTCSSVDRNFCQPYIAPL
jgi:hypothetical protein